MKISFTNALRVSFTFILALCVSGVFAQTVLTINNSGLSGEYEYLGSDNFGPPRIGTITGDLIIAEDGDTSNPDAMDNSGTVTDCCQPITNNVTGKVALIDRGVCFFERKILAAEAAGAVAAIICNNEPLSNLDRGGLVGMAGVDTIADPNISSAFLTFELCERIKAEMQNGTVNITLSDEYNIRGSSISYAKNTPVDQIVPLYPTFSFFNRGTEPQDNLQLACEITDPMGNTVIIDTTLNEIPPLDPDMIYGFTLPTPYTPSTVGEYSVRFYNNGTATTNYTEGVDEELKTFSITDDILSNDALEAQITPYKIDGKWAYGTILPVNATTEVVSVSFVLAEVANLVGETINIILYPLDPNNDGNIDEDGDFAFGGPNNGDIPSVNVLGYQSHTVSSDDVPGEVITVEVAGLAGEVPVLEGTSSNPRPYLLMIEHVVPVGTMSLATTDYNVLSPITNLIDDEGNVLSVYGSMRRIGDDDWRFNYAEAPPVMHINTSPITDINLPQLEDSQVTLMPNPASETVNIALDLKETAETVQIHLLDIMGRAIQSEVHNNVQDQVFSMDVRNLAAGTYFVNVITDEGRKALKLTVK